MTLALHPDMLEATYELLRTTPPFRGWKLPAPDEIEFRIARFIHQGEFISPNILCVSARRVSTLYRLAVVTAHEMCHLRQHHMGTAVNHGAGFERLRDQVCRHHLFDPKEF